MTAGLAAPSGTFQQRLARVISETLRIPIELALPEEALSALGMDSLAAVELTAAIEDEFGIELPLSAVHEFPTLSALCAFIEGGASEDTALGRTRMLADAVLPPDIAPILALANHARHTRDARNILLTGATGFVGAYLLHAIAAETDAAIHCLVRPRGGDSRLRLREHLTRYGLWSDALESRIHVVEGDVSLTRLGLARSELARLAAEIDVIYHAAADVDWVAGYEGLRSANVLGTTEILRFACTGVPKPVHFLSSVSVCHSTHAPRQVDEDADPIAAINGLWMGYAQTKCVAETLVRAAGARGLPVTIIRPSLVSGDRAHGRSNPDDLISRFIAGCVRMRAAPDLDWRMDVVPVDEVARSIVKLTRAHATGIATSHIAAVSPRHWRECVLWMRLAGYDIDLIPYREWMERLRASTDVDNPLHALRSFFLHPIAGEAGLTLPELFEETRRAKVDHTRTRALLSTLGHNSVALDTRLLARYFDDFEHHRLVPPLASRSAARAASESLSPSLETIVPDITRSLRERLGDDTISIESITLRPVKSDDSIVAELTSWRGGSRAGLYYADVTLSSRLGEHQSITLFVKSKPVDADVIEVANAVAALASPTLGEIVARFREHLGFTRAHIREVALYADRDPRLRWHTPAVLATHSSDASHQWIAVLESIDNAELSHTPAVDAAWPDNDIETAIVGLAEIHAVGFERRAEFMAAGWQAPARDASQRVAMSPLWLALATHAFEHSTSWADRGFQRIHEQIIDRLPAWACALDAGPSTLIHNDFNPRNIAIRSRGPGLSLCAFDWELATMGPPQRDLAELLASVLAEDAPRSTIAHWVERHRALLSRAAGVELDRDQWERGFSASLCDLLVDRLASYAMVDRIRAQTFLPRVVRGWNNLFHHYSWTE